MAPQENGEIAEVMGLLELQDLQVKWEDWGSQGIKAFQGSQVTRAIWVPKEMKGNLDRKEELVQWEHKEMKERLGSQAGRAIQD